MSWLAIGLGAAIGAWLRWGLGLWLNPVHGELPLGTLAANLGGGYLIGLLVALFSSYPEIAPEWRLFAITGFLGGLTTFSTFSAESMLLLQRGEYMWAAGHSLLHLIGSVLCCIAGFASWRALAN
ncbi:fluoride efflux transporter CrcB [Undibacterium terreum]|uniref:Fluoride-specific ion channel FluC n=1 Tax=Undibacterium terreum TaxID=1224302 RepID=A0A916V0V3_9BURK|nr:fluoride efflux transporter CrcB [Undibacterium terreum]GGC99163.1 putative fluoride ion transporter CrcB [Undibacterium terreum]